MHKIEEEARYPGRAGRENPGVEINVRNKDIACHKSAEGGLDLFPFRYEVRATLLAACCRRRRETDFFSAGEGRKNKIEYV